MRDTFDTCAQNDWLQWSHHRHFKTWAQRPRSLVSLFLQKCQLIILRPQLLIDGKRTNWLDFVCWKHLMWEYWDNTRQEAAHFVPVFTWHHCNKSLHCSSIFKAACPGYRHGVSWECRAAGTFFPFNLHLIHYTTYTKHMATPSPNWQHRYIWRLTGLGRGLHSSDERRLKKNSLKNFLRIKHSFVHFSKYEFNTCIHTLGCFVAFYRRIKISHLLCVQEPIITSLGRGKPNETFLYTAHI